MQTTPILAELFRFNGAYIPKLLKAFSPESFFVRPEHRGNPMIWLLGHVVLNRGEIVEMLGGDPQTADLGALQQHTGVAPEQLGRRTHAAPLSR